MAAVHMSQVNNFDVNQLILKRYVALGCDIGSYEAYAKTCCRILQAQAVDFIKERPLYSEGDALDSHFDSALMRTDGFCQARYHPAQEWSDDCCR